MPNGEVVEALTLLAPAALLVVAALPPVVAPVVAAVATLAIGYGIAKVIDTARNNIEVIRNALGNELLREEMHTDTSTAQMVMYQVDQQFLLNATKVINAYPAVTPINKAEATSLQYEASILQGQAVITPEVRYGLDQRLTAADIERLITTKAPTQEKEVAKAAAVEMVKPVAAEAYAPAYATIYVPPVAVPGVTPTPVIDASPIAAALPAVGFAVASALAAASGQIGHNQQGAQAACGVSTTMTILNNIAQAAMPLMMSLTMEKFGPARQLWNGLFDRLWSEIVDSPYLTKPVKPEQTPELSRHLFFKAMELGQTAHLISVVAEAVSPLKSLGLNQLAAFITDMSGFAKIGGAMMGALESQALTIPFRYFINKRVRSILPDVRTLSAMASEYALVDQDTFKRLTFTDAGLDELEAGNRKQFMAMLPYQGTAPEFDNAYWELKDNPASYFMLRAMADAGMWDPVYYRRELANRGYNVPTIRHSMDMLYSMTQGELKPLFTSVALRRFKEGLDSPQKLQENLTMLGVRAQLLPKYVMGAQLQVELEKYLDDRKALEDSQKELRPMFTGLPLKRFREGQDNLEQLTSNLAASGVTDELMPRYVFAANLDRDYELWAEAQKAAKEKPKELQPVMLSTATKRFKEGIDTEVKFTSNLVMLGIDPRLLPRYTYAAQLEADYDDMMDYLSTLKAAVAKGAIEPDAMKDLLIREGMDEGKAHGYARRAAIQLLPARKAAKST